MADDEDRVQKLESTLWQMHTRSKEKQAMTDEKKSTISPLPVSIIALILALGGGGVGATALLDRDDHAASDCQRLVNESSARTREMLSDRRRENETAFARREEVAAMSAKLDLVMERLEEIREDVRSLDRRPTRRDQ